MALGCSKWLCSHDWLVQVGDWGYNDARWGNRRKTSKKRRFINSRKGVSIHKCVYPKYVSKWYRFDLIEDYGVLQLKIYRDA